MNLLTNKTLLALVSLLAIGGGAWLAHWQQQPRYVVQNATVLDFPRALPTLDLIDHRNEPFDNARLERAWTVLFFGFTHCPDVCPTTMSVLAKARERMRTLDPDRTFEVIMISVDPERDRPEVLEQYVPFFDPDFLGVTGTTAQIQSLAADMGVAYRRVPTGEQAYTVDHTSALFVINPEGALQAISSSPHVPDVLANDLLAIAER
ncbi:MAG: SCO family protein [Pseudomonadota bacterium]